MINQDNPISRADINQFKGPLVVEFGATWCGYCQAAQPIIAAAFVHYPDIKHIKIEDGKGLRLGRSFAIKLWPTLLFIRDGVEIRRLVRPNDSKTIADALNEISIN